MITPYKVKLKTIAQRMNMELCYEAPDFDEKDIVNNDINRPGLQLAGFYDYFEPSKMQLIGRQETTYLQNMPEKQRRSSIDHYMSRGISALVFCHETEPLPEFLEAAEKYGVSVLKTHTDTAEVMAVLIEVLNEYLAPRITRHGVLVEVYGEGILLTGESGIGKSETAVELIKRGHRLIADDAVELRRSAGNRLIGNAPKLTQYYMELRGIGIINVRRMFGMGAIKSAQLIDLVIKLENWKDGFMYDRIGLESNFETLLDVSVPTITIPVKPGRNIAMIVEVAAMNNRQKKLGMNSAQEFTDEVNSFFENQQKGNIE
jgi:HPr kinase/phosphorylase